MPMSEEDILNALRDTICKLGNELCNITQTNDWHVMRAVIEFEGGETFVMTYRPWQQLRN